MTKKRKIRIKLFKIIFILCISAVLPLRADEQNTEKNFIILPFAFYTSDTGLALGLFSQYRFPNSSDKVFANAIFTFKEQFMFFSVTDKTFNDLIFHHTAKVKVYKSEVYGVGNDTSNGSRIKYEFSQADNTIEAGKKITHRSSFYLKTNNFFHRPGKNDILSTEFSSKKDQFANGLGFSYAYKNISDKFFRDGIEYKTSLLFYPSFLGNTGEFTAVETEFLFCRSFNQSALNTLAVCRISDGDVHPEKLSSVGGDRILRGYNDRRYIDRHMLALQLQYDFRIYKKLSGCAFSSVGDVFKGIGDLSADKIKFGYGAGAIIEYKGLVLRFEGALPSDEFDPKIIVIGMRSF
jgi:hypothetical protein